MSVPNNANFNLRDITTELGGGETSLPECFANANASGFDATYNSDTYAPANSMLRFRNYSDLILRPYFNGVSSEGIIPIGWTTGIGGTDELAVKITANLSDLTTRVLFEAVGVVLIKYNSALQNITVTWNTNGVERSISSLQGLIVPGVDYEIDAFYEFSNMSKLTVGSKNETWSADDLLYNDDTEMNFGYSSSDTTLSHYKGGLWDFYIGLGYSGAYVEIYDLSESYTEYAGYTASDITLVLM